LAHDYSEVTKSDNIYSSVTTPSKIYNGVTKLDNEFNPVTTPDKTYSGLTKSDNAFTAVSDITPGTGDYEEKFKWNYINTDWDTWLELTLKPLWADWVFITPFVDAYTSLTTPAKTYTGVTKSDNAFSSVTTPSKTHTSVTKSDNSYVSVTTPSQIYSEVTK